MEWMWSKINMIILGLLVLAPLLLFQQLLDRGVFRTSTQIQGTIDIARVVDMVGSCPSPCEVDYEIPRELQMRNCRIVEEDDRILVDCDGKISVVSILSPNVEVEAEGNILRIMNSGEEVPSSPTFPESPESPEPIEEMAEVWLCRGINCESEKKGLITQSIGNICDLLEKVCNRIGSLDIITQHDVRLYDEEGFEGRNICFQSSVGNLDHYVRLCGFWGCNWWVNDAKSVEILNDGECTEPGATFPSRDRITDTVLLFNEKNYEGRVWSFNNIDRKESTDGAPYHIKSVKIKEPGLAVMFYEPPNIAFYWSYINTEGRKICFRDSWNDITIDGVDPKAYIAEGWFGDEPHDDWRDNIHNLRVIPDSECEHQMRTVMEKGDFSDSVFFYRRHGIISGSLASGDSRAERDNKEWLFKEIAQFEILKPEDAVVFYEHKDYKGMRICFKESGNLHYCKIAPGEKCANSHPGGNTWEDDPDSIRIVTDAEIDSGVYCNGEVRKTIAS